MVNGQLVFGSGKLCKSYSKPQKPRLGQFSSVILTRHRPSQPGFSLHSSLASSFHMPPGQFSTRTDSTWAPCLRLVDTPRMPSAFWANCQVGKWPPRVLQLTPRRFASTWPSSSPAGWGAHRPLHSALTLGRSLQPLWLQIALLLGILQKLDKHLQPIAADSPDLGTVDSDTNELPTQGGLEEARNRGSRWWLNGVVGPSLLLTGLVFAQQTAGVRKIEVRT